MNIDKAPCLARVCMPQWVLETFLDSNEVHDHFCTVKEPAGDWYNNFTQEYMWCWWVVFPFNITNVPAGGFCPMPDAWLRKISGDPDAIDTTDDLDITKPKETIDA